MSDEAIVVGWTPNAYGRAAVSAAVREAALRGHRLVVVNATKGDALVDERYAADSDRVALESEVAESGVPLEIRQTMGVDVAEQVLAVADEVSASLVVIGLRRRSPVGKLIMGSVAQRILLSADCPVLAVKPSTSD
jgi:nucleotide-binding universal stress UspA family protein